MARMRKIFCSEFTANDEYWFLIENDEAKTCKVSMEFKLDGYILENSDAGEPNVWSVELEKGGNELRHMQIKPKEESAKPKKAGGFNPMAGLMDEYEMASKSFSYKVKLSDK